MNTQPTPWKADADVFSVSRPAASLIHRMEAAVANLVFTSADPTCTFHVHTRMTEATAGPALVVTDVAQYEGGQRRSAVVVSAVVHDDPGDERLVVIRTHTEDDLTPIADGVIEFEGHHDTIRASLARAVRAADPDARHRSWPDRHAARPVATATPEETVPRAEPAVAQAVPVRRAAARADSAQAVVSARAHSGIDPRQVAGLGLLIVGVLIMFAAIASGSPAFIVVGVAAAACLGFAGNHIAGG